VFSFEIYIENMSDRNLQEGEIRYLLENEDELSDFELDLDDNEDNDPSYIEDDDHGVICDGTANNYSSSSEDENEELQPTIQPFSNSEWDVIFPPEPSKVIDFSVRNLGARDCPPRNSSPLQYFELFFKMQMWVHIVQETNKYAEKILQNLSISSHSRFKKWASINVNILKKYVAIIINMGLIVKKNQADYWDVSQWSQSTPFFPKVMSLKRFELISRMLHLNSSVAIPRGQIGFDPWHKISPMLKMLNEAFKKHYIPKQNVSIDESMIGMKNRFIYLQYMPQKRHCRFGIKKFEICESDTGYVHHIELYSGKDFPYDGFDSVAHKVVVDLLEKTNLLGKGYHVFTDNWYTKIPLAQDLLSRDTYLTGTIRKNSRGLPKELTNKKLTAGETLYMRKGEILLVGYKETKTRKPVYCLTSGCHAEDSLATSKSGRQKMKPILIQQYNYGMGGVDNSDKSIYHHSCSRPTRRYWKKIFMNLLDITIFNAYILYKQNTDKPLCRRDFMVSIVEDLAADSCGTQSLPAVVGEPLPGPYDDTQHLLTHLPGRKERLCAVCDEKGKKSKSVHWCPGCNCGVHTACFHLLKHYHRNMKGGKKRSLDLVDFDGRA
jgi:hypothetical protein